MSGPWHWECAGCGAMFDWHQAKYCKARLDNRERCGRIMRKVGDLRWFDKQPEGVGTRPPDSIIVRKRLGP